MASPDLMCGSNICAINVIGDPAWVLRALEGLSMLTGSGNVAKVAAIGLLLGLIVAALKAILTGGEKFEIQNTLVGYILYMVMFVPTVNIQIDPLVIRTGYVECGGGCRVDDVPIGAAGIGVAISNIGYGMARGFEQAFGTVTSTESQLTHGGFGNGLEAIAAFRNLDQDYINSVGTTNVGKSYDAFRKTLKHYLHDCTLSKIMLGRTTANDIFNSPNPMQAIIHDDAWLTTIVYIDSGRRELQAPVALTCREAGQRLQGFAPEGGEVEGALQLTQLANAALAARTGNSEISTRARDFFSVLGARAQVDMNQYTAASMIHAMFNEAMLQGPMSSERIAQTIMVQQGSEQRATQWAAEETMFRRVVTPVASFFEGFLYVVMPFMAFLFGFGAAGIGLAVKLAQTAIWIQLFAPVLAAVNLFQVTAMQSFARRLQELSTELGQPTPDWTSITAVGQLQAEAIDWLAVGSMIAAATPAIALMILYGGAVAATNLASRLQGSDHINEKVVSNDAMQPAPALQMSPGVSHDPSFGTIRGNSSGQQIGFDVRSEVGAQMAARLTQAASANNALSRAVSDASRRSTGFSEAYDTALTDTLKNASSSAMDVGWRAAENAGFSSAQLDQWGVKGQDVVKTAIALNSGVNGGIAATPKAIMQTLGRIAGGLSGLYSNEDSQAKVIDAITRIQAQIGKETSTDEGARATMLREQSLAQADAARTAASQTLDQSQADQVTRTADEARSASASLDSVLAMSNATSTTAKFTTGNFAETMLRSEDSREKLQLLESRLLAMGLGGAITTNQEHARQVQGLHDPDAAKAAALLMTATMKGPGIAHTDVDEGKLADAGLLAYSFMGYGDDVQNLLSRSVEGQHTDNLQAVDNPNVTAAHAARVPSAVSASAAASAFTQMRSHHIESQADGPPLAAPLSQAQVQAQGEVKRERAETVNDTDRVSSKNEHTSEVLAAGGVLPGEKAVAVQDGFRELSDTARSYSAYGLASEWYNKLPDRMAEHEASKFGTREDGESHGTINVGEVPAALVPMAFPASTSAAKIAESNGSADASK